MQNQRLASRYAKSIIDLAIERNQLEDVLKDMQYLQQVMKGSPEFLSLIKSPVVPVDKKNAAVAAVIGGQVSEITAAFVKLLISKHREIELPDIITTFLQQYKANKGIQTVKLTTATPVSEEVKQSLIKQVQATSDFKNIDLETTVDPDIIGGFVLQAGDKLIDASIKYDLKTIGREFENNDFIYKVR